jgi:hypothetical protein
LLKQAFTVRLSAHGEANQSRGEVTSPVALLPVCPTVAMPRLRIFKQNSKPMQKSLEFQCLKLFKIGSKHFLKQKNSFTVGFSLRGAAFIPTHLGKENIQISHLKSR